MAAHEDAAGLKYAVFDSLNVTKGEIQSIHFVEAIMKAGNLIITAVAVLLLLVGLAQAQDSLNVTKVGEIFIANAALNGIAISGNYAYAADYNYGLRVINVSNPASPWEEGNCTLPGNAYKLVVCGDRVYIADFVLGLRIIDVSNPSSPVEVGFYEPFGIARGVDVSGNYAYLADEQYVRVINVQRPDSIYEVGSFNTLPGGGPAWGIVVLGNYAYEAEHTMGLRVIDVSDPSSPIGVGLCGDYGYAVDVAISGNYAYVADFSWGLMVVDISNPYSPVQVGSCGPPGGYNVGVAVSGDYIYAVASGPVYSYMSIFDVSNPVIPEISGFYPTPGGAQDIAVSNNYAYVADGQYFSIYDCSAALPVNPFTEIPKPTQFSFNSPSPNPINPTTNLTFTQPHPAKV
ncbi:MAG: hypothetical protein NTW14_08010 [bacterium]|nr:hypothetical protein [bacterium]